MPEPPKVSRAAVLLLIEADDRAQRVLLPRLVRSCGRVLHVASPELALQLCADHAVDLVLVSAMLPDGGAVALCRALRDRGGPPIIAYRMGISPDAHVGWFDAGGADCLSGDDPVLVAARCRAVLRRRRAPLAGGALGVDPTARA